MFSYGECGGPLVHGTNLRHAGQKSAWRRSALISSKRVSGQVPNRRPTTRTVHSHKRRNRRSGDAARPSGFIAKAPPARLPVNHSLLFLLRNRCDLCHTRSTTDCCARQEVVDAPASQAPRVLAVPLVVSTISQQRPLAAVTRDASVNAAVHPKAEAR